MYDDSPNLCPIGDAVSRWSNVDPVVCVTEGSVACVITAGDECALHLVEPRIKLPLKPKVMFAQSIFRILRLRTAKYVVSN